MLLNLEDNNNVTCNMKTTQYIVSLVSILFVVHSNHAQTTINASDLPQAGGSYLIQTSTADITGDYVSTGANYVWDFSTLDSNSETLVEFGGIAEAPALAQFSFNNAWTNPDYLCDIFGPGEFDLAFLSELGIDLPVTISNMMSYYQTSGSSYNLAGISMNLEGFDIPIEYSDIDEIYTLPLNFQDVISSTSAYEVDIPSVLNYATSATREGSVDGWGTLLLPNGASHEVLRISTTITTHDVLTQAGGEPFEIDRISTVYTWLGDGGLPYLEAKTIFGTTYSLEYQGEAPNQDSSNTDGITVLTPSGLVAFPNPASSGENIVLSGADQETTWEISDFMGKIIISGMGPIISTDLFSPGSYIISTSSEKGLNTESLRVIIQ
tara:strand:+ start:4072 stop:5211 length:1140 start_codon:yes stop_codon:yes gene_type:complete